MQGEGEMSSTHNTVSLTVDTGPLGSPVALLPRGEALQVSAAASQV